MILAFFANVRAIRIHDLMPRGHRSCVGFCGEAKALAEAGTDKVSASTRQNAAYVGSSGGPSETLPE